MRWGVLWMFIPDEALLLIVLGLGFAVMFGLLTFRVALGLIVALAVLPPFVEGVLGDLPPWVSLVLLAVIGLAILRGVAALLIGQRAADTMAGNLGADIVRLVVRIIILPLRVIRWAFRDVIIGARLR